jgi:hypothetical protein
MSMAIDIVEDVSVFLAGGGGERGGGEGGGRRTRTRTRTRTRREHAPRRRRRRRVFAPLMVNGLASIEDRRGCGLCTSCVCPWPALYKKAACRA